MVRGMTTKDEQTTRYTIEEAEHRRERARTTLREGDLANAGFHAEKGLAVLARLQADGARGEPLDRLRKDLEDIRAQVSSKATAK
jgi:HEPN domain-containing protein